ncbi:MAG: hypothetical protein QW542_06360, partial [Thermoproteota archaeon]
ITPIATIRIVRYRGFNRIVVISNVDFSTVKLISWLGGGSNCSFPGQLQRRSKALGFQVYRCR